MAGLLENIRRRVGDRDRLVRDLADRRGRLSAVAERRAASRQARIANADRSIELALAWLDEQLDRYGDAGREIRPVRGPDGQPPMVVLWLAAAGGPAALAARWRARLSERKNLHDDSLADLDRETRELEAQIDRLEHNLATLDEEQAEIREALS